MRGEQESDVPMFHVPPIDAKEKAMSSRIKLVCLVVIALAVVYMAMEKLQSILVPFMLAVALSYLLSPIIEWLVNRLRVPRFLAMLVAFCVAIAILATVGLIVIRAVANFTERKDSYQERVEELLDDVFDIANAVSSRVYGKAEGIFHLHSNRTALQEASVIVNQLVAKVSVTEQIMGLLGTTAHAAEEAMYITLFLIFLLHKHDQVSRGVDLRPRSATARPQTPASPGRPLRPPSLLSLSLSL